MDRPRAMPSLLRAAVRPVRDGLRAERRRRRRGSGWTADLLTAYVAAVTAQTLDYLATIGPDELDRVVDRRWDPPVTLGVRLVSVVNDDLQHLGQAAYAKGLLG